MAASTTDRKRNLRVLGLGAGLAAAAGLGYWLISRSGAAPTSQTQNTLTMTWSGLKGTVSAANGQALPTVTTVLANGTGQQLSGQVTLQDSAGLTFTPSSGDGSFDLAPGASATLQWQALWDQAGGGGPFNLVATVEGTGMGSQQFTAPYTFSVQVQAPAAAAATVDWASYGPSVTVQQGSHLPDLYTTLINSGTAEATFQVTISSTDGVLHLSVDTRQSLPSGLSAASGNGLNNGMAVVTLAPGASMTIPWTADWESPTSDAGIQLVATVDW